MVWCSKDGRFTTHELRPIDALERLGLPATAAGGPATASFAVSVPQKPGRAERYARRVEPWTVAASRCGRRTVAVTLTESGGGQQHTAGSTPGCGAPDTVYNRREVYMY